MRLPVLFALPCLLSAQLIPVGQPVPKTANPPVVFLDGYQSGCGGSDFASNFGAADKLMQANSIVTLYFDNCTVSGPSGFTKPDIESVAVAFGKFLGGLKYTDGSSVPQVDVVAHSMGGLIVRSYLAGKQPGSPAVFTPPANPGIRRIIFLATPHFGTTLATLLAGGGADSQTTEMSPASSFLLALNSWNQGTDDLRGIPAISIAGNGGSGFESMTGFDDGVVTLSSSSLGFYRPGVTRIVPDCHTLNSLLVLVGFCSSSAPALNMITNDTSNPVSQIIVSYLTGTTAWQSIGQAAEANSILSMTGGLNVQVRDQGDNPLQIGGTNLATVSTSARPVPLTLNGNSSAYLEALPAATSISLLLSPVGGSQQMAQVTLPATTVLTAIVKPGPIISPRGVICAAGPAPFPYDVAAGAFVSIYGSNLASSSTSATQPYPTQIGDLQVLVNGVAQPLVYASPGQINFVYANSSVGLTQVTVKNAAGQNTVNVRVAPAVPSIFLLDSVSTAAAVDVTTATVVSASAPFHAADVMSLYATGLGATTRTNGLDYAQIVPTVSVGGQNCPVSYAGRAPSFAGLDQINCAIPSGVTGATVPVTITSNGRISNTAFIPIH
jgi:uncharacterized protein (TIGR03437 family)